MVRPNGVITKQQRIKPVFENVLEMILDRIQRGDFSVGRRMPSERELAITLDVSRGSVREALRVLEQQGFIESMPGGGRHLLRPQSLSSERDAIYNHFKEAAIDSLLEARETLDDKIVELACLRATEQDIRKIEKAYKDCCDTDSKNPISMRDIHDRLFHLAIAEASHNSVFESVYELNMQLLSEIRIASLRSEEYRQNIIHEHTQIFEAIVARDSLSARLAARIHHRNICMRHECFRNL